MTEPKPRRPRKPAASRAKAPAKAAAKTAEAAAQAEACPAPALHGGVKTINLALQGGGAHGAYTWGALDRLLQEPRIEVEGISGTSAGAMNAAAFKSGYKDGDREGARAALNLLWTEIGDLGRANFNPMLEWVKVVNPTIENLANAIETGPRSMVEDTLTRMFSPYDLNPFDFNPLRRLLTNKLDFGQVCAKCRPHLFISATNVRTGKIRVFKGEEVTVDAILASACLPSAFQTVEVDDPKTGKKEAFWDGGFAGNPALFPLFYETEARDIVIVHINPIRREEIPRSARDIANRVNEISFNASLMFELRAIEFVRRLIDSGAVKPGQMKDVLVHSVADDSIMSKLGVATKVNPDSLMLEKLRDAGAASMDTFLTENWEHVGARTTADVRAMLD